MKRSIIFMVCMVFGVVSFLAAADGPFDVTKVDIFSLKKTIGYKDVSVYGITVQTPLKDALKQLKKTEKDIRATGRYKFLDVEPGFKLRLAGGGIDAILISEKFQPKLKGATAKLFDNIDSEAKFKSYVIKYFMKPDDYKTSSVAGFESNTITYILGIKFTRFHSREGSQLVMEFSKLL